MLCKESKEYLTKIADILAQLLQADDPQELLTAQNSLLSLFKIDAKGIIFQNLCINGFLNKKKLKHI